MTTKYSVKRCNTFGFAQSLKNALTLFKDLNNRDIIYLHYKNITASDEDQTIIDKLTKSNNSKHNQTRFEEVSSIDDFKTTPSKKGLILVELGYTTTKNIKVPIEYDDTYVVEDFEHQYGTDEFKKAVLALIDNEDLLKERKFSNEFVSFLIDLYPELRDYNLKKTILNLLNYNDYNTLELEKLHPFEYENEEIKVVSPSPIFSDIEISIDINDKNISTSLYKPDKDLLKKASLGKTTQLDAFSENKFAIIHTKKRAGIENKVRNQNHDVLDSLAVNGVMKSPETKKPLSIYKLVRKLEKFDKFDIVFIHPSYEVRCMNAEYPCEQIIPAYRINEGEILAVIYRYIVIYFFGYCSIFTDSMLEWRYYI
jgi:hypothetical protein